MSLAVILVTRNAQPHITEALAQAVATADEVVAVDGASTDGTWELLCRTAGVTPIRQRGIGLAAARNQGIAATTAARLLFLDADDRWLPGKTKAQQAVPADVVSCHLQRVALANGSPLGEPQPALTPSGCLFRREVFQQVGGFDPQYTIAADHDWFVRARAAGITVEVLPAVLLHKGVHEHNTSHDRATYRRELLRVFHGVAP